MDSPVVIVGAGLMGAASAWALARRGRPVIVLEQYDAGHALGSSHGSARIVRRAYGDALYTRETGHAFELWAELERTSGAALLRRYGALDFGPRRDVPSVAAHLADAGVEHEVLPADEAATRWPDLVFEGDVLFHPQAGTLDAALAVTTMLALARGLGADVRHQVAAAAVRPGAVECSDGSVLAASAVVVAAGAWLPGLVPTVDLPPLRPTLQGVFHFPRLDPAGAPWPSVIHAGEHAVYHLAGGRDGGPGDDRKLGSHDDESPAALGEPGTISAEARARAVDYVRRWLPGLDPTPRTESTCLYTRAPSEDFVLDRVDDLVICSPCSGHGAKFAPLVGEWVADLVEGVDTVPARFRLAAHRTGLTGAVSL